MNRLAFVSLEQTRLKYVQAVCNINQNTDYFFQPLPQEQKIHLKFVDMSQLNKFMPLC